MTDEQFWTRLLRDAWLAGVPAVDVVEATARLALMGDIKARPFDEPPPPTKDELENE